jgi:hypothetical protein
VYGLYPEVPYKSLYGAASVLVTGSMQEPVEHVIPTGHCDASEHVLTHFPLLQVRLPPPCMAGQSALLPH